MKFVTFRALGCKLYGVHGFPEEATMRQLIEILVPDDHQFYWRWVGGMFAFYVVLMVTAAGVFVSHESSRNLAHEGATTVAIDVKQRSIIPAAMPVRQVARY